MFKIAPGNPGDEGIIPISSVFIAVTTSGCTCSADLTFNCPYLSIGYSEFTIGSSAILGRTLHCSLGALATKRGIQYLLTLFLVLVTATGAFADTAAWKQYMRTGDSNCQ